MDRLTKCDIDGCLIHPWSFNGINGSYDIWDEELLEKQIDRLAAYEDTGLEPEDFKKAFNETAILKLAAQALSTTPDHLRELLQAENEGRLVVLALKGGESDA